MTDLISQHLSVNRYGKFILTDAIRPALDVPIRPSEGYKIEIYRDRYHQVRIPMLCAAVSAEKLFDVFLSLLELLGKGVHVILESSHENGLCGQTDRERRHIDVPVLASHLCDYEDLLLNDGCTGIAVISTKKPIEIQFDEHKQITIYAANLKPFQRLLREHGIRLKPDLKLLSEAEHLHHSTDDYAEALEQLAYRLGVTDTDAVYSDADEE